MQGHAYGILQVQVLESGGKTFSMIQCRNPWGMGEWLVSRVLACPAQSLFEHDVPRRCVP